MSAYGWALWIVLVGYQVFVISVRVSVWIKRWRAR